MKIARALLVFALTSAASLAFATAPARAECPAATKAAIRAELEGFTAKLRTIWPELQLPSEFGCDPAADYNGYYDGSRKHLHYFVPADWTRERLRGPVGHELGHALWSALTEKHWRASRLRGFAVRYAQAEKSLLPRSRKLARRIEVAYAANPESAETRELLSKYGELETRIGKLLRIDGLGRLYFALDELVAGAVTAFLNQDPKADAGDTLRSHRDFSIEFPSEGWSERLYENRRLGDLYSLLAPVRFPMGSRIVGADSARQLPRILDAFAAHLESRAGALAGPPDEVDWDAENRALIRAFDP